MKQPYVGPRPFDREDGSLFYGRDTEARDLALHIVSNAAVVLYSPSGAGKTSLIKAKLVTLLERDGCDVLPVARVHGPVDTAVGCEIPNVFVLHALQSWMPDERDSTRLACRTLADILRERRAASARSPDVLFTVAIFDQFEELFTASADRWRDRKGFFEDLQRAFRADPGLRVLFAMREDRIAELDRFVGLLPDKLRTRFRLERLGKVQALEAVIKPLEGTGRRFAPKVAEALVHRLLEVPVDGRGSDRPPVEEEFVEPVQLQVVCQNLWQNLPEGVDEITCDHLEKWGDVNDALERFYETCLDRACSETAVKPGALRRWFETAMITPEGTRGIVYRGATETGWMPNSTADLLEQLHIIRSEPRAGAMWYELTHDRLIEPIRQSNRKWVAKRADAESVRQRLHNRARRWTGGGRRPEDLLSEIELIQGERWLESPGAADLGYSDKIISLVQASRAAVDRDARQLELTRAEAFAAEQSNRADAERARAEQERLRAETERARAEEQTARASLEAYRATNNSIRAQLERRRARQMKAGLTLVLLLGLAAVAFAAVAYNQRNDARAERAVARSRELAAHALQALGNDPQLGLVLAVEASRTSATEQATDALRQAYRAELDSRHMATLRGHSDTVWKAAFTPDDRFVVSASADATARVWNTTDWKQARVLQGHGAQLQDFAISRNGEFLATEAADSTAIVWFLGSGKEQTKLTGLGGPLAALAFSPDGALLVTETSEYSTEHPRESRWEATLWDVRSGQARATLRGHTDAITFVSFSPDGRAIVTASADGTARVWNAHSGQSLSVLRGHSAALNSALFSPDSKLVVTASDDGTARLWDPWGRRAAHVLRGSGLALGVAVFSDDGRFVAAAARKRVPRSSMIARDGTATSGVRITAPQVAPDIVTLVWSVTSQKQLATLGGHTNDIYSIDFSPAGDLLASGGADGTARVWETATWQVRAVLKGHSGPIHAVDFNGDGSRVATASHDSTVRIWDTTQHDPTIRTGGSAVIEVAFHPGASVTTIDALGKMARWDTTTKQKLKEITWDARVHDSALALQKNVAATLMSLAEPGGLERRRILLHHLDSTGILAELDVPPSDPAPRSVSISADGRFVAATTGSPLRLWAERESATVRKRESGGLVWIWTAAEKRLLHTLRRPDRINHTEFSPDGAHLVTAGQDGEAQIWSVTSGKQLSAIRGTGGPILKAVYSLDSKRIAIATSAGIAEVWRLSGRDPRLEIVLRGHTGPVFDVKLSREGRLAVTVSSDNTARLWDVATGQKIAEVVPSVGHQLLAAALRDDGRYAAIADSRGEMKIVACNECRPVKDLLSLATARVRRTLTPEERKLYLHEMNESAAESPIRNSLTAPGSS